MSKAPFDEAEAAARLGHPGEAFKTLSPYVFEGVFWVVIGTGEKTFAGPVIVESGHVIADKGYAIATKWLRRVRLPEKVEPSQVAQVMQRYDGLPPGWDESAAGASEPVTGDRGGFKARPLELKLVSPSHIPARRRAAPAPAGNAPPGPPPGPPGPPGGVAPPRPSRATLREVGGKLTWILEAIDPGTKQWKEELREAAEQ